MNRRWFLLIWPILLFLCASCLGEDGNDAAGAVDDDASVDDDAGDVDDDDVVDDDAVTDDDLDDDSTDDDAIGGLPPGYPLQILVTARQDDWITSWVLSAGGWRELPVPRPETEAQLDCPAIVVRDGQYGYSAANEYNGTVKERGFGFYISLDHHWLDFDLTSGWRINNERPSAGAQMNIVNLQAPGDGSIWADAKFLFIWVDSGIGPGPHEFYWAHDQIVHLWGQQIQRPLSWYLLPLSALNVPTPDFGMAWIARPLSGSEVWKYDGENWSLTTVPPDVAAGAVTWFWFDGPDQGYAVWQNWDTLEERLYEIDGVNWEPVPTPVGCEAEMVPHQVFGANGYAVAISADYSSVFWEKRDGVWRCRVPENLGWGYLAHAVVTPDQQAYLLAFDEEQRPCILLVTADGFTRIELPSEVEYPESIHLLGPGAPPVSYWEPPFTYWYAR